MLQVLTDAERQALIEKQKTVKDRDAFVRIRSVLLKDQGWSSEKIAEALSIHQTTVDGYLQEYQEKQKLSPEHKGSQSKLSEQQTEELRQHVEQSCYMTAKEIVAYGQTIYKVSYSVSGMTYWLKSNGFVHKKPKKVPYKADPEAQKAFVARYNEIEKEAGLNNEPVLFVDFVHPCQETAVTYGWIKKGSDKLIPSHGGRKRMTICGALNLATMALLSQDYETINQESFLAFLGKIRQAYPGRGKIHLLLDQAGYHIAHSVKDYALQNNILLHYLPPHSPNLNAIERLWKYRKETVIYNKFYEKFSFFKQAIEEFLTVTYPAVKESLIARITDNFHIPSQAK
jgi:transposase